MSGFIGFIIGLIVGVVLGFFVAALAHISADKDNQGPIYCEAKEEWRNETMNDEREKKLREAAEKMKSACDAFYESDESCSACPAYIENKLTGETRCYFSDTWTEPHDWDV